MTHDLRCKICDRLIPAKRQSTYHHATTCGKRECFVENRRRVHNALARHTKRRASAPERGATDTFLAAIRRSASGALVRAVRAFRSMNL